MRKSIRWALGAAIAVALAGPVSAGVSDPVPLIGGTLKAKHVFSIPGVTTFLTVGTIVSCTSLEKRKDQTIAVEVFSEQTGAVINDITLGGSQNGVPEVLSPGETVMIEISHNGAGVNFTVGDAIVSASFLTHGSARVVSTSTKLMCTAAIVDPTNSPPMFAMALQVVAKTKQKGD